MRRLHRRYIIQHAEKTSCPKCHTHVELMLEIDATGFPCVSPMFYICWNCKLIAQVGKGPITHEED